jgi:hypothetical protein
VSSEPLHSALGSRDGVFGNRTSISQSLDTILTELPRSPGVGGKVALKA